MCACVGDICLLYMHTCVFVCIVAYVCVNVCAFACMCQGVRSRTLCKPVHSWVHRQRMWTHQTLPHYTSLSRIYHRRRRCVCVCVYRRVCCCNCLVCVCVCMCACVCVCARALSCSLCCQKGFPWVEPVGGGTYQYLQIVLNHLLRRTLAHQRLIPQLDTHLVGCRCCVGA